MEVQNNICILESDKPRVVIIGAGFAGIHLSKALSRAQVQVVMLDKNNYHQFQPLLYQVATSGLEPDSITFPIRKVLSGSENTVFRMADVQCIDRENNRLITNTGNVDYDILVIATGSVSNYYGNDDFKKYGVGLKTINDALNIRSLILQNFEKAANSCDPEEKDMLTNVAIVGGGPAGVEMAGALAEFKRFVLPKDYPEFDKDNMKIYLIQASGELLQTMSEKAKARTVKDLEKMGVEIIFNVRVKNYDGETVDLGEKGTLKAATLVWTAGVKGTYPKGIPEEAKIGGGRILVNDELKVNGTKNIYAIGDIAGMISDDLPRGHPMVAQAAMQEGTHLAKNIIGQLKGKSAKPFKYKDKGSMATIGKKRAVADIGNSFIGGFFAWILWSTIHLLFIIGFKNKFLVGLNWGMNYITYDKGNRLIIRKYKRDLPGEQIYESEIKPEEVFSD
jgi:NADH dehydrogenase